MRSVLMTFVATCLALVFAVGSPALAKTYKWDMPNEYTKESGHLYDEIFAQKLKEKTNGAIVITNHYGGALGYKSKNHWAVVEDGAAPIASTYTGVFTGYDPIFLLVAMPFIARNIVDSRALYYAAKPYYAAAFEKGGQKLVLAVPSPPVGIWAKQRVTNVEELKQIRIRTYDKTSTVALKAAGADVVQLSWADIVPALSTGTIDSVLTSGEGGVAMSFFEHTKFFNAINYVAGTQMFHMNKRLFDSLPANLQQAILDTAREVEEEAWDAIQARIDMSYVKMKAQGVTAVHEGEMGEGFLKFLQEATTGIFEEWAAKMPAGAADKIMSNFKARAGIK